MGFRNFRESSIHSGASGPSLRRLATGALAAMGAMVIETLGRHVPASEFGLSPESFWPEVNPGPYTLVPRSEGRPSLPMHRSGGARAHRQWRKRRAAGRH